MVPPDLIVESLRATGLYRHSRLMPRAVSHLEEYFRFAPVYDDAHVSQTAKARGDGPVDRARGDCWCVDGPIALLAPYLLEVALALAPVAAAFLEAPPWLYSANAFWTRPSRTVRPDIQEFHRDADDDRFLVMFTYLTDVTTIEGGPHELRGPDDQLRNVLAPAGTIFLADTSCEHRGLPPSYAERGVHWFRWSVNPRPAAYGWDGTAPIPASRLGGRYPNDPELRRMLEPLVTP